MAIKRKKKNKSKKLILIIAGLAVFVVALVEHKLLVHGVVDERLTDTAKLVEVKNSAGGDKYSLNLDLARQATYYSPPFSITKLLPRVGGITPREISFKSEGLKEYGLMTEPTSPMPINGYPVIILLHGFVPPQKFNTDGAAYLSDMIYYSQHGYVVIRPDLRGNGKSEGIPEGAYYSMAYNVDIMSLISSVQQTAYLNKSDITLWGHSMGGYLALRAAVLSPDIKRVVILSGSVGTPIDMFTMYFAPSDELNPIALKVRSDVLAKHGSPLSNPQFWEATSPLNYLSKTNAEFQIHVGSNDRVVPPEFSADLSRALEAAHRKYQYYIYAGADHGLGSQRELVRSRSIAKSASQ